LSSPFALMAEQLVYFWAILKCRHHCIIIIDDGKNGLLTVKVTHAIALIIVDFCFCNNFLLVAWYNSAFHVLVLLVVMKDISLSYIVCV